MVEIIVAEAPTYAIVSNNNGPGCKLPYEGSAFLKMFHLYIANQFDSDHDN